ncbi:MAG: response regulator transcription factor [Dietzia sp.]|uniref:response regulator n=1 Tax=Dietzia TaxID=37914 RepID=UPI0015FBC727|nr:MULTISPECIES: response regulator transcription factor [Dietzia]MBB1039230.1 response regulator transcription factor [Dietzia natronolimnaea]MBB1052324.1 response regulator transcription factor [Dietzia sp. CW19]MBC7297164.1 response regulator transcription factor [Dietzia sp.]MCT1516128.1 response regulator transcription factor [Dietzia cercidiphylli]MDO8394473.1 response regulator transcription factor [Dietzia sp.]
MSDNSAGPDSAVGEDSTAVLRILVVDDQALMRSGFSMMLGVEPDLEVIGDAADGAEAVEMCRRLRPDVVLMDVQMPGTDGIEATRLITAEALSKVLILTTFDRDDYLFDALRAGASGFLLKNSDPEDLVDGVRAVGHGHALLAPEVTRRVIERLTTPVPSDGRAPSPAGAGSRPPALDLLTARETEVLRLVARGLSNAEIARTLVVGEATVKTHVSACLSKLHLRDRVQAVVLAYEAGLVQPGE